VKQDFAGRLQQRLRGTAKEGEAWREFVMWAAAAPSPVMLPPQQQGMFAWDGGVESPGSPMQVRGAGVSGIGMMSAGSQIAEMQHGGEDLWHRRGGSAKAPVHLQIADIPMAPALSAIPMAPRNRPGDLHATLPTGQGGGGVDALQQVFGPHPPLPSTSPFDTPHTPVLRIDSFALFAGAGAAALGLAAPRTNGPRDPSMPSLFPPELHREWSCAHRKTRADTYIHTYIQREREKC
jgi:hypothetical protein